MRGGSPPQNGGLIPVNAILAGLRYSGNVAKEARIPVNPAHPERICWGCTQYCAADDLRCGNGSERAQHPVETYGPNWQDYVLPIDDVEA